MRKHLTPVSTIKQEGSTESCKEVTMDDALTGFVDQLNAPVSSFPSLMSEALKWTDLVQDTVYQIVSTRTVTTQHGQCGMLTKELLQNPMTMVISQLFVRPTGLKRSKIDDE